MAKQLAFLIFLVPVTAVAANDTTEELDTIVVTASRTPISVAHSGSSLTVINRDEIERRQLVYVADVLRDVPGVSVSRSGTFGSQTQIRMRGSEANQVLVMIDGIEVNDPAIGGEFQFEHLTTADIDRIEIVRGPQSALWGSDALGGVINIITRHAETPLSASGYIEGGSFGTVLAGGRLSAAQNAYAIDLSVSYLDTDGSNIARTGAEDDGYSNNTINLTARLDPSERWHFEFSGRRTDTTKQFDGVDFAATGLPIDADLETDATQNYLRSAASFSLANWTHRLSATYLDTKNDNFAGGVGTGSTAAEKLGVYYQATLRFSKSEDHTLTIAVDHEQEDFHQRGTPSPLGDPNQDQTLETTAYVVEYRAVPFDSLALSAAVRYDDNSDFDEITTYRLSTSYLIQRSNTRLRASYGTGQKSPTFLERFGFFPDLFLGNPNVAPESSRGWEIGFEQIWRNDRFVFMATYFNEELKDEINGFVFDPNTFLFTAANEIGTSDRQGVELMFSAHFTAVDVTASYTVTDSTQPDGSGGEVDEVRRPRHMVSANLNYAVQERTNINLNVSYNGSQYDLFFPPFPQPSEQRKLDGYTLVNLAASYQVTNRVQVYGRIENLFDEQYEDVLGFNTPGIGAFVGVRLGH